MIAASLSILLLLVSRAVDTDQPDQGWTAAGIKNGVALAFRDDPQLNARQVRAVAELPHTPGQIIPVVCDFTQTLDPDTREARVRPGGSIPGWMVRRGAVSALPEVIRHVARCLASPERRDGRCPKPS